MRNLRASNLIESSIFTARLSYPCQSVIPTNNAHIETRAFINIYREMFYPTLIASYSFSTIIYPTKYARRQFLGKKSEKAIHLREGITRMEWNFYSPRIGEGWLHVSPDRTTENEKTLNKTNSEKKLESRGKLNRNTRRIISLKIIV